MGRDLHLVRLLGIHLIWMIWWTLTFLCCQGQGDASGSAIEDTIEDYPSAQTILDIENFSAQIWEDIWNMTNNMEPVQRTSHEYINEVFWPKFLEKLRDIYLKIKEMDQKILYQKKPSSLMDAIFKFTSLKKLQLLVVKKEKTPEDELAIRFAEISSSASQMHRFFSKRMRDILRDDTRLGLVATSILNYKTYVWKHNATASFFAVGSYKITPELTNERTMYMNEQKDIFQGIHDFIEANPDIALKAQYKEKMCQDDQILYDIEPTDKDIPFYILFHLSLVDIKYFNLINVAYLYNQVYQSHVYHKQDELREEMRKSVQYKIDLFENAFGSPLNHTKRSYNTYPGVGTCDPPALSDTDERRNWVYGESYEKLTNFIKIFVAPEQELHKAGNCKMTCDVLDGTYKPCADDDVDCRRDEEMDCYMKQKNCTDFTPPCPIGQYQCQDATSQAIVCPSTREDRLYEYVITDDEVLGNDSHDCSNTTVEYKGGWVTESDVLADTPHFCEICTCYCFEPLVSLLGNFSVRYILTGSTMSLWQKGMIVVGVKFERFQDRIQLRIAEAKIKPNFQVDASTINWSEVKSNVPKQKLIRLSKDLRSVNLDDVVNDASDRVVTGVGLYQGVYMGSVQYQYVGLQIITHQVNLESLEIMKGTGKLKSNRDNAATRIKYTYPPDPDGPDDPLNSPGLALPDSTSNQYCVFMATSLKKDAAQSTIPYFDIQELIRPQPVWLKGIGIYHKSSPGFGGFLSLKLIEHTGSRIIS